MDDAPENETYQNYPEESKVFNLTPKEIVTFWAKWTEGVRRGQMISTPP
jgi:hypothetical protein